MDWLKHLTNASRDEMLVKIERDWGLEGYARYWKILELIGQEMKPGDDRCSVKYDLNDWCNFLKGKPKKTVAFLEYIGNISGIYVIHSGNVPGTYPERTGNVPETYRERMGNVIEIKIPKILKLRDSRNTKRGGRGVKDLDKNKSKSKSKSENATSDASQDEKTGPICIDHKTVLAVLADKEIPLSQFYAEKEVPENFEAWGLKKEIPQKFIWKVFKEFYEYFTEVERKRAKNWYMAWQKWVHNDVTNFGRTDNRYTKIEASGKQTSLPNVSDMMAKDPRYADKFATK